MIKINSPSPTHTYQLGKAIGSICEGGEIIALNGELGSGKTVLTQGIAKGLGIHEFIHSPTFTLINEYSGSIWLFHVDFYRLQQKEEITELGLEEYVTRKGVLAVEWANKFQESVPIPQLAISFKTISDTERELKLQTIGSQPESITEFIDIVKNAKSIDQIANKIINKVR